MSHDLSLSSKQGDDEYVDIHGRDIPTIIIKKTGEIAFPLSELRQTGVGIYQKSQYAKLATVNKQFDDDFHTFMLESAKRFMLTNKIPFPEEQILKSIINCKNVLSDSKKPASHQGFLNDRVVEEKDDEILIQVRNVPTTSPASNPKRKTFPVKSLLTPKKITFKEPEQVEIIPPQTPKAKRQSINQSTSENANSAQKQSSLRPPKAKILEKAALEGQKQSKHEVLVTCIDKRNCVWVRDKANSKLFDSIHKKVNEEANYQKLAPKPWQLEKVYMAPDEGSWFRCKVIRFSPLTVFFLDYGNVEEVDELRLVSEELAKIPCMAVRLTFREIEYVPNLEDEIVIKIMKQNDDGTYFVNVLETSPQNASDSVQDTNETVEVSSKWKEETNTKQLGTNFKTQATNSRKEDEDIKEDYANAFPTFFKRPARLCSLENGQKVVITHEERGVLYLRTKECHQKLKNINEEIEEEVQWAEPIERVDPNQLVLVREDGKYHRAAVLKIVRNKIHVEFLDFVKKAMVNLADIVNISESLSREPVTYFQGHKLKGFDELDEQCKNLIAEHIQKQSKFVVVLDTEGDFDLSSDGSQTLSQQLHDLKGDSKKILLQDMKRYEPKFGIDTYLCGCFKDSTLLALVPSKDLANNIDSVLIQDMEDDEPYVPVVGEVCFCFYMDHWYRSVVTRILNNQFEVLLLDFGNSELVRKEDLRKPNEEMKEVPLLALPCRLTELPDHPKVEELLKKMIIDGELYNVDVKNIRDGKYEVQIPCVYQEIRKTPL